MINVLGPTRQPSLPAIRLFFLICIGILLGFSFAQAPNSPAGAPLIVEHEAILRQIIGYAPERYNFCNNVKIFPLRKKNLSDWDLDHFQPSRLSWAQFHFHSNSTIFRF
jgi:hypothetical protein